MGMPEVQQSLSQLELLSENELQEISVEKTLMDITTRTNEAYAQLRTELTTMK